MYFCTSEDSPEFAFYIQGTSETCYYILYHIIMAIIVACLLIACLVIRYLKMRYPRPHFRYNNDTLYGLAALMFGFEVFIIYSLIHKLIERCYETPPPRLSDVQPKEEPPQPSRLPPTAQNAWSNYAPSGYPPPPPAYPAQNAWEQPSAPPAHYAPQGYTPPPGYQPMPSAPPMMLPPGYGIPTAQPWIPVQQRPIPSAPPRNGPIARALFPWPRINRT